MKTTKKTTAKKVAAKAVAQAARPTVNQALRMAAASLESLQANVIIADPNFKIVYINGCAMQTLGKIANEIRHSFGVEIGDILGSSIHTFHRNAASVERILTTPQALPYQTEFSFGCVTLQARINRVPSANGATQGYIVAWEDVSYRQRLELDYAGQIAAIQRSQAVIEFDMDGVILNANDIFLKTLGGIL